MIEDIIPVGTVLIFLVFFLFTLIVYNSINRLKDLPPGPTLLPFIGNLHVVLRSDTRNLFNELRREYGDVFSLKIGCTQWIVFNRYEVLKESFVRNSEHTSSRPDMLQWTFNGSNIGIVIQKGEQWKENRRFALKQLRHFGMGSHGIGEKIQDELRFLMSSIQELNGESFDVKQLLLRSISNIITSILFNKRSDDDSSPLHDLIHTFDEKADSKIDLLMVAYPFLSSIPGLRRTRERFSKERVVLKKIYEEHIAIFEKGVIRDFMDAYIDEFNTDNGEHDQIDELQFLGIVRDLYEASTETTSTALRWALIHLIRQPNIQDRIRAEIYDIVGTKRTPCLRDRSRMPYTEATIMEVLRLENVVPFAVSHTTENDVYLKGQRLPKGAWLLLNLESVAKDERVWEKPEEFSPTRFLDRDGSLMKKEKFIPFSLGRRICLGESLARSMLFLFLTTMVQRFDFLPEKENQLPGLECLLGEFLHRPVPYKLKAVPRTHQ